MAVLRLALVLSVLTVLQADAVQLSSFDRRFTDTIAALANDVGLRIGNRVQDGDPQGGEPYVGRPVLEPGTMFLMGSGLLGICVWARRRWVRRR